MPNATERANARTLTPEPCFRVAHLFEDESLKFVFRSAEGSMPRVPVLPASPFVAWKDVLDENGFIPAPFVLLSMIDRNLSELRYRRINGAMTKDDRQSYRALEKLRAAAELQVTKEATR
jgi:hypothetical protein